MTHCQDMKSLYGQKRNYLDIVVINQSAFAFSYWNFNRTLFPYKFNISLQCFSPENVPCQAVISHSGIAVNILEYE